jgi:hypothetical protein
MTAAERTTMGIFPVQRLKEEVRIPAAATIIVVAALVFIEGLMALWTTLIGFAQFHFIFQLGVFGLIGGPLLLVGSRLGYWYSLIDMTANAILCTAYFMLSVCVDWLKFWNAGLISGSVDLGLPMIFLAFIALSMWSVRVLRSAEVQSKFGLLPPPGSVDDHKSLSRGCESS